MNGVGLTYVGLVTVAYVVFWGIDRDRTRQSARAAASSLGKLLPLLLAIFGLIGLFQAFFPPEYIERWMGSTSGVFSLLAGGLLGAVSIGPPAAAFPLAGSLLQAGAWAPAIGAFILSWVMVGVLTLPFESRIFGMKFTLVRNLLSFAAALLIGWILGVLL